MADILPRTAVAYTQKVHGMKLESTQTFFDKFQMMDFKLDNNTISIKKQGSHETLKFELHAFGPTKLVMNETKAFKIDMDSMAECTFLTKYFGPYNITKTNEDQFIFSKGGESALLSKAGW